MVDSRANSALISSNEGTGRVQWIDFARGAGIALVVFGHVWRGLMNAGLLAEDALYRAVDDGIYLFHMPLFFFISGLLFTASDQRREFGKALQHSASRLLYPLVLWTYVFVFFRIMAGNLVNRPMSLDDIPAFPLPPFELFWFLWALFVIQIAVAIAHRIAGFGWLGLLLAVLFNITAAGALDLAYHPEFHRFFNQATEYMPFFLLGMAFTARPFASSLPRAVAGALLLGFLVSTAPQWFAAGPAWRWPAAAAAVLCCVPLAVQGERLLESAEPLRHVTKAVRSIGRASLAIYVAHVIFSAALRIVLHRAGVTNLWIHASAGTAIGIAGPMALLHLSRRLKIEKWLGFSQGPPVVLVGERAGTAAALAPAAPTAKRAARRPLKVRRPHG
jgi:fucose 4-O-acetylase-like acetyltransferase